MSCNDNFLLYTHEIDEIEENIPTIKNISTIHTCIADLGREIEGSAGNRKKSPPNWIQPSHLTNGGKALNLHE